MAAKKILILLTMGVNKRKPPQGLAWSVTAGRRKYAIHMRLCGQERTKTRLNSLKLTSKSVTYWNHYLTGKSGLRHHLKIISRNSYELRLFCYLIVLRDWSLYAETMHIEATLLVADINWSIILRPIPKIAWYLNARRLCKENQFYRPEKPRISVRLYLYKIDCRTHAPTRHDFHCCPQAANTPE